MSVKSPKIKELKVKSQVIRRDNYVTIKFWLTREIMNNSSDLDS